MSTNTQVNSILSRPHEDLDLGISDDDLQEVQLAFALTGIDQTDLFSPFFPLHRLIAAKLVDYFISLDSVDKLIKVASFGRQKINPNLFNYAFCAAVLNRSDTKDVMIMHQSETFADKFFPAPLFAEAAQEVATVPEGSRRSVSVEVPSTATAKYAEVRLEYFRQDMALNVSYCNWHLMHPCESIRKEIVDLDRCGELWYYFHQQTLARYNSERHCNGLLHVKPLSDFNQCIEDGYFPKLCTQHLQHSWAPRFDNSHLYDLCRPFEGLILNKTRFQRWIDRVCNAIELGFVKKEDGTELQLNNDQGVDILGNILRSSVLSVNRNYYGDIGNMGHALIAYCHDPQNLNQQAYGVMGEPATCMRDPVFYRWYAFLVRIVQLHKMQLPSYTDTELGCADVKITALSVEDTNGGSKNQINTKWENSDFNLKNSLNYQDDTNVYASIKHLQHDNFQYVIDVQNDSSATIKGTIRLFLSQKTNTRDRDLTFEEMRTLWIELDRFQQDLQPGANHIIRQSTDSSVTVPSENFFQPEVVREKIKKGDTNDSIYCLTGWPAHLLIPKGTPLGATYVLFAMVSRDDAVNESLQSTRASVYYNCKSGSSYCGLSNSKYPDKRSMGFPFDRPGPIDLVSFPRFLRPNMIAQDVIIKFAS